MSKLTLVEAISELRALMQKKVIDKKTKSAWVEIAMDLEGRITSNSLHDILPEYVIHYLFDADVRLKDPEYGKSQEGEVKLILQGLEETAGSNGAG